MPLSKISAADLSTNASDEAVKMFFMYELGAEGAGERVQVECLLQRVQVVGAIILKGNNHGLRTTNSFYIAGPL